jgi:hypothetical protein
MDGKYIWAIIQTISGIVLIGKAEEMNGFNAFFAIGFSIIWIIGWWIWAIND